MLKEVARFCNLNKNSMTNTWTNSISDFYKANLTGFVENSSRDRGLASLLRHIILRFEKFGTFFGIGSKLSLICRSYPNGLRRLRLFVRVPDHDFGSESSIINK